MTSYPHSQYDADMPSKLDIFLKLVTTLSNNDTKGKKCSSKFKLFWIQARIKSHLDGPVVS